MMCGCMTGTRQERGPKRHGHHGEECAMVAASWVCSGRWSPLAFPSNQARRVPRACTGPHVLLEQFSVLVVRHRTVLFYILFFKHLYTESSGLLTKSGWCSLRILTSGEPHSVT